MVASAAAAAYVKNITCVARACNTTTSDDDTNAHTDERADDDDDGDTAGKRRRERARRRRTTFHSVLWVRACAAAAAHRTRANAGARDATASVGGAAASVGGAPAVPVVALIKVYHIRCARARAHKPLPTARTVTRRTTAVPPHVKGVRDGDGRRPIAAPSACAGWRVREESSLLPIPGCRQSLNGGGNGTAANNDATATTGGPNLGS